MVAFRAKRCIKVKLILAIFVATVLLVTVAVAYNIVIPQVPNNCSWTPDWIPGVIP